MKAGIAALILAYVLSQFYRAFLAVLSPVLGAELGVTPADLAVASGYWFLTFALMQIPVGWALDRFGPRRTAAFLLALGGGGGAAVFATATGPLSIQVAMGMIGVGCSPVLMASYFIFARSYTPAIFGTLAGMTVGIGNLGNIGASLPLSIVVEAIGWRPAVFLMVAVTLGVALAIFTLVRDPARVTDGGKGRLIDLLFMPALWPILIMMGVCYAPAAAIRGLWVGPYFADVFGADAAMIGQVSLVMGLSMVLGSFAYGPLERALKTRKGVIMGGNILTLAAFIGLYLLPASGGWVTLAFLCMIGFFGASFPMVIAHGRAFIPPAMTGRGVTLLNLFGIAPVGIMQIVTGQLHSTNPAPPVTAPYVAIFLFIAVVLAVGLVIYAFSRDRTD